MTTPTAVFVANWATECEWEEYEQNGSEFRGIGELASVTVGCIGLDAERVLATAKAKAKADWRDAMLDLMWPDDDPAEESEARAEVQADVDDCEAAAVWHDAPDGHGAVVSRWFVPARDGGRPERTLAVVEVCSVGLV